MSRIRHFLRDDDLDAPEQRLVLHTAERLAESPHAAADALRGEAIGLLFQKPSLRTRVSSEVACARLGATSIQLRAEELQLARGETPADSARVLVGYLSLLLGRVSDHRLLEDLAEPDALPIVNGLSDRFHPLQSIADLLTLQQEFGHASGRKLAYVGDGNNVASSLLLACPIANVDIAVATPSSHAPPRGVIERAEELAGENRSIVTVTDDPIAAVKSADAVYTDVWTSMGNEGEESVRAATLAPYQLNTELLEQAPPHSIAMHCLPAHRGEEITDAVLESPRSRIFQQAHNRLPATAALLLFLLEPGVVARMEQMPWEGTQ
jgi:ornithine carbamoyltransferase